MNRKSTRGKGLIWFIAIWFATLPISAAISIGSLGGIDLTISRIAGILMVLYVTILLPFVNLNRIPRFLFLSVLMFILYMFIHVFYGEDWLGDLGVFVRAYGSFALLLYLLCTLNDNTAELIKNYVDNYCSYHIIVYISSIYIVYSIS